MRRVFLLLLLVVSFGCDDDEKEPVTPNPPANKKIVVDPAITHQEMVGFGGALTWYSDRMISSSKKNEIAELLFNDLGTDIVRFQAFYYPNDYPNYKGTANMSYDNSAALYNTTGQIYSLMNNMDPGIKVLLSSWGPPAALKSNGSEREGHLKKNENGEFMYDEFAQYWVDILDNMQFDPDYISIQNEPTYINPGWTTSQWSGAETGTLPGYNTAFDKVYDRIKDRPYVPVMIGPESANTDSFAPFAELLKNKDYLGMYCYHPYNINSGSTQAQIDFSLQTVKSYNNKPNLMTEFSDNLSWFNTALFINNTLTKANSSGYIYWKMVWATPTGGNEDVAMISINGSGNYTVTPFYYLIKHFAKNIDAGDKRVEVTSENTSLSVSGFIDEDADELTLIIINTGNASATLDLEIKNNTVSEIEVVQSKEGSYYQEVDVNINEPLVFPSQSITTITLGM